jgi:hypothetical protein
VVSFTPLPLYLRGKSPQYTLDRKLYGLRGEEKIGKKLKSQCSVKHLVMKYGRMEV